MVKHRIDRGAMLKGVGVAGAATALMALHGPLPAHAAETAETDGWGLEGTWIATAALGPSAPFHTLSTYAGGGSLIGTAQTGPRGAPGRPGSIGSHHGTWARTGELTFQRNTVAFTFDPTGAPTGTHRVEQTILMAADGQSYSADGTVTIADVTGKVLHSSSTGTEHARRMTLHGMPAAGRPSGQ